jgi:hypothetical protein
MKPQFMLNKHDPENGSWGDCHRCAIASLLDMEAADVPHFFDNDVGAEAGNEHCDRWLAENFRLRQIMMIFDGSTPLNDVLFCVEHLNPGMHYILGGESSKGCGHSVIAGGGKIVHDPNPENTGIVGPMNDGFWWITFLGRAS